MMSITLEPSIVLSGAHACMRVVPPGLMLHAGRIQAKPIPEALRTHSTVWLWAEQTHFFYILLIWVLFWGAGSPVTLAGLEPST